MEQFYSPLGSMKTGSPEALLVSLAVRHRGGPDADAEAPPVKLAYVSCRRAPSRTALMRRMMRYAALASHILRACHDVPLTTHATSSRV